MKWFKLPKDLAEKIRAKDAYAKQVALGHGGAWVALFSDKTWSWNLAGNYVSLGDELAKEDGDDITFVALDPNRPGYYFLARNSGLISYSFTGPPSNADNVQNSVIAYMQKRAREDGTTFKFPHSNGNIRRYITISPTTTHDKPGLLNPVAPYFQIRSLEGMRSYALKTYPLTRRENMVAMGGAAAFSTAAVCRTLHMSMRATMLAAGVAAGSTGAICSFIQR